jgi:hypothetical protein
MAKVQFKDIKPFLYVGAAIAAYEIILKPFLDGLHITKSAAQIEADNAGVTGNVWQPNYWQQFGSAPMQYDTAKSISEKLYGAPSIFNTDPVGTILGAFKQISTQAQASYVVNVFYNTQGTDLYGYLQTGGGIFPWDGLSASDLNTITNYLTSLPTH